MLKLTQKGNPLHNSPVIEGWPDGPVTVKVMRELLSLLPDDYTITVNCFGSHHLPKPRIASFVPCYDKHRPTTYELVVDIEGSVKGNVRKEVDYLLEEWGNDC